MHKKGQGQQHKRQKPDAIDEENQPFLKSLAKKIRNLYKKLAQISELEQKEHLKPEQIQKINRKDQINEEIRKLEDTQELFKSSYQENVEEYRNQQFKQLENLAKAIVVYHSFPNFSQHSKTADIWKGLYAPNGSQLGEAVTNLSQIFKKLASDRHFQSELDKYTTQNTEAPIELRPRNGEASAQQERVEVHTDEIVIIRETTTNQQGQPEEIEVVEKIHDGIVQEVTITVTHDQPQAVEEKDISPPPTPTQTTPKEPEPVVEKKEEQKKDERPNTRKYDRGYKNNNRQNRDNQEKGQQQGEYHERKGPAEGRRNYRDGAEKRAYKPKFEEKDKPKETVPDRREKSESSSDSSVEDRRFKKDEIKKLEEEGFTVVKPKPKPQHGYQPQQGGYNAKRPRNS